MDHLDKTIATLQLAVDHLKMAKLGIKMNSRVTPEIGAHICAGQKYAHEGASYARGL